MIQRTIQEAMEAAVVHQKAGRLEQAEHIYRQVLAVHPDQADALHLLGVIASNTGRVEIALQLFCRAIERNPTAASYHLDLGVALERLNRLDEAMAEFEKAISLKADSPKALSNLANLLSKKVLIPQTIAASRRAIELRPDFVEAYNNLGNGLAMAGQWAEATAAFEKAISIAPDFALGHFNLATMLLLQGNLERGWAEYEWRFRVGEFGPQLELKKPLWDGRELGGRRILLHAEQGLGDVIQFARYLPEVAERGGRIIMRCNADLHRLLARVAPIEQWATLDEPIPEHEMHCSLISLPHVFKTTLATIPANVPYFSPGPLLSGRWRERIGDERRRKTGLCWAGRGAHARDRDRSIPIEEFAALEKVVNVRWFSLQKDPHPNPPPEYRERGQEGKPSDILAMTDWTDELRDFADTAALIANLDLVISVDTSVAHLAGAMGKPVWLLLPFFPDWRWMLDRADSPWYPTMRLFRQKQAGDWKAVLQQIAEALTT